MHERGNSSKSTTARSRHLLRTLHERTRKESSPTEDSSWKNKKGVVTYREFFMKEQERLLGTPANEVKDQSMSEDVAIHLFCLVCISLSTSSHSYLARVNRTGSHAQAHPGPPPMPRFLFPTQILCQMQENTTYFIMYIYESRFATPAILHLRKRWSSVSNVSCVLTFTPV